MTSLSHIGLQNFQVFAKFARFPLARLNLLFGPNSAGKSALLDALQVLAVLFPPETQNRERFAVLTTPEERWRAYEPHFRRESSDAYAKGPMILELGLLMTLSEPATSSPPRLIANLPDPMLVIRITVEAETEDETRMLLEAELDGECIYRFDEAKKVEISLREDLGVIPLSQVDWIESAIKFPGSPFLIEEGILRCDGMAALSSNLELYTAELLGDDLDQDRSDQGLFPPEVAEVLRFLGAVHDSTAIFVADAASAALGFIRVPASRSIPKPKELRFDIEMHVSRERHFSPSSAADTGGFADIAMQAAARALATDFDRFLGVEDVDYFSQHPNQDSESATSLRAVNRAFSDHMFLESGYQVRAELSLSADAATLQMIWKAGPSSRPEGARLDVQVQLLLEDHEGRRFHFDEVGSGIGYVLPVIVRLCSTGRSFIEQPELHLHPALQAAVGDVIAESVNAGSVLIIETHSEHLLLRLLRRIRQTSEGRVPDQALLLRPDDLSILYLDPSSTGGTTVKRLRVNEEGDFLDRWPNGFFSERDQELFDE